MTRGTDWAVYTSDEGFSYAVRVDRDYIDQVERGWTRTDVETLPVLPRQLVPRRVFGQDANGAKQTAICAHTGADLWQFVATSFTIEATDGTIVPVQVTGRLQERSVHPARI